MTFGLARYLPLSNNLITTALVISFLLLAGTRNPAKADTIVVPGGGDLQAAISASHCGDEIVLQAGATYTVPGFESPFLLRYKAPCSGTDADYITIRTSNLAGLPISGTRITPDYVSSMAKLLTNVSTPVLEAEANAHYYKFIGIEITNVGGNIYTHELVNIGERRGIIIPYTQKPHHITFDRCWIHEATNDTTTQFSPETTADRGFNINGRDIKITDSRIAGFRGFIKGFIYPPNDPRHGLQAIVASNAILFPQSPYNVLIDNTYLEAWFVPIFFGGSGGETDNFATVSNPTFNPTMRTGTATLSTVRNLNVGDLIAFKVTGGMNPNGPISHQAARVTGISGNNITFVSQSSMTAVRPDGSRDPNGGNPLLLVPDSPGEALWNGYLPTDITFNRCRVEVKFEPTEYIWTHSNDSDNPDLPFGDPSTLPPDQQIHQGHAPKGSVEVKMGRRVTFNGNTFGGWGGGFTVTTRNQGDAVIAGHVVWSTIEDFVFTNNYVIKGLNWMRPGAGGMGILGEDYGFTSGRAKNWRIENNLFADGAGPFLKLAAVDNLSVKHNTFPSSLTDANGSMLFGYGYLSSELIFEDNIVKNNAYGVNCQTPDHICWPDKIQRNNVIIDNRTDSDRIGGGPLDSRYPTDMITPSESAIRFVDPLNANYRLSANSPYKGRGTNGSDPGVDMDALLAAIGGGLPVPTPTPSVTPTPTPSPTPNPSPGVSVTSPVSGSNFMPGSNITINANATVPNGVARVDFYRDGLLIGTDTSSPYSILWTNVPNGSYSLTAKATDSLGAIFTSSPVVISVRNSPESVNRALLHANSLVGGMLSALFYEGAADSDTVSTETASDLDSLALDIQQAYFDFQAESSSFGSMAVRIEAQLRAALLFGRADAALARKVGSSASVRSTLLRVAAHLAITQDLMLLGSISSQTAALAAAANARTDVLIGPVTSGYGVTTPSSLAQSSLGAIVGNPNVSPLTTQTTFATPSIDGSLPYELAGVSVTVGGVSMPLLYVSPNRVMFYVPANTPYGSLEMLVTSQDGFVSNGLTTIANSASRIMTAADVDNGSAVVMNGQKLSPNIEVTTPENFGSDKRTRLMVYATGISGTATNSDPSNDIIMAKNVLRPNFAESVRVEARRSDGRVVQLPVEFAGMQGTIPGLDQINVVLPPELQGAGTVGLTLIIGGQRSNAPTILIH